MIGELMIVSEVLSMLERISEEDNILIIDLDGMKFGSSDREYTASGKIRINFGYLAGN